VREMEEGRRKKEEGGPSSRGFRRLVAYHKATHLATAVDAALSDRQLPAWLVGQVMRAATSVYANIAEGYTRGSLKDYIHFLDIARASLAELESHLDFMVSAGKLSQESHENLCQTSNDVGNLIVAHMRSLRLKLKQGQWNRLAEPAPEYHAGEADRPPSDPLLPPSSFLLPGEGG